MYFFKILFTDKTTKANTLPEICFFRKRIVLHLDATLHHWVLQFVIKYWIFHMLIKDDKEISYFIDINFNVGYIKVKDSHTHLKIGK